VSLVRESLRELAPGRSHAAISTVAAHSPPVPKPTATAAASAMATYSPPAPKPTAATAAEQEEEAGKRNEARRGRGKSEARARDGRRDGKEGSFGKDAMRGTSDAIGWRWE